MQRTGTLLADFKKTGGNLPKKTVSVFFQSDKNAGKLYRWRQTIIRTYTVVHENVEVYI